MKLQEMYSKSDYQKTGKLYPKLDSYMLSDSGVSKGNWLYMGNSCQFKSMKAYRHWLLLQPKYAHLTIKIMKGE